MNDDPIIEALIFFGATVGPKSKKKSVSSYIFLLLYSEIQTQNLIGLKSFCFHVCCTRADR